LEINNKAIGLRIWEERKKFQLTREEFAEIIGLSEYYIGQLERGERQMSLPVMIKISNCLLVSLDYLVFGKGAQVNYIYENPGTYDVADNSIYKKINFILKKCSPKELKLIFKVVTTILPYISKK
jgi:transcriptional regulator with XRE-family HTH domain